MKKVKLILSTLLPILFIVGYIFYNKYQEKKGIKSLEEFDEKLLLILKDTSSNSYKFIKKEFILITKDSIKIQNE